MKHNKTKVGIHQPNYIPWLGYFKKIYLSDIFIFLDTVQYTKGGYQNRAKVLSNNGAMWLTQPVRIKGLNKPSTNEIMFNSQVNWKEKHIKTLETNYSRSPYFKTYFHEIKTYFKTSTTNHLAIFNQGLICLLCDFIGIKYDFYFASELNIQGGSSELLIGLCNAVEGNIYISGEGGRNYQDEVMFNQNGIIIEYFDVKSVTYNQQSDEFVGGLSILDVLFYSGSDTMDLIVQG